MTVKELIEKRAKAWETAKDFVNTHEDKNGNLSAEDAVTYSRMEAEIEELTNSIDRQQRAERREQELSKPVNSPITGNRQCLQQCVPISDRWQMYCRKVWMPMAVTLFLWSMTTD